jgi:hypothetical protein
VGSIIQINIRAMGRTFVLGLISFDFGVDGTGLGS